MMFPAKVSPVRGSFNSPNWGRVLARYAERSPLRMAWVGVLSQVPCPKVMLVGGFCSNEMKSQLLSRPS